jgi:hypothetical protein
MYMNTQAQVCSAICTTFQRPVANINHTCLRKINNYIRNILSRMSYTVKKTGRQGKLRTKLLDDLKERRGYSHLKEETLDRTMWRARFGRGFGPVLRQTTK